jgi:(R)-2-hydroxyacyl-CoA dehydratese activating ATPase
VKPSADSSLWCGIDIGARSVDIVLFDGAEVRHRSVAKSGARPQATAEAIYTQALASVGVGAKDIKRTVSTGYGRHQFKIADAVASEILCQAAGVHHLFPEARTIVDIGGQDSKAIWIDARGRVLDFAMNDRCAAGTGRFIEMVAQILGLPVEEVGPLAVQNLEACEISSMCAVFAESEIIGLLQMNATPEMVLRGVCRSVAKRTTSLLSKREADGQLVFTGGVALNCGVAEELSRETQLEIKVPVHPLTTGALGAALIALAEDEHRTG